MGTITISIDNETEEQFRATVKDRIGIGKGKLGTAVQQALKLWTQEQLEKEIQERELNFLHQGFHLGKHTTKREQLYER